MYFPLFVGVLSLSLSCFALLCVHSIFAIILKRQRKLVTLLLFLIDVLIVALNVLWLFLTVPWVGLQFVIVVFTDHTHLLCYGLWLMSDFHLIEFDKILYVHWY